MTIKKPKVQRFMAEIDETELACRIMEATLDIKRPKGTTAEQAFAGLTPELSKEAQYFRQGARAAMLYWVECLQKLEAAN